MKSDTLRVRNHFQDRQRESFSVLHTLPSHKPNTTCFLDLKGTFTALTNQSLLLKNGFLFE